jgi:Secretion system C-terminal sorting domain/GEVED domain
MKSFTRLILTTFAMLSLALSSAWAQVSVTATGGTASGSYATISAAFAAINAGTHTGSIQITVTANITEPAAVTPLEASGVGLASYTAISLKPSGDVTVSSDPTPTTNRGLVELKAADNVTIDGDDPLTPGVRNLTFQMATSTNITAVIRISSNSTTGTAGADNNTVKNCIIIGSRPTGIATTMSYGINASNYSTTSLSTGAYANLNTTIDNNEIRRCYRGIHLNGASATYPNTGVFVTNNIIGSSNLADNVGNCGIFVAYSNLTGGTTPSLIEGNDVRCGDVSPTGAGFGATISGIDLGTVNSGIRVLRNNVHDVMQPSTGGWGAYGINISGSSNCDNILLANNMINNVVAMKYTTGATSTYIATGIRFSAGATLARIINNTVVVNAAQTGATVNYAQHGIYLVSTMTAAQILNNIVINNGVGTGSYAIYSASNTNISAATVNNNNYSTPSGVVGFYGGAAQATLAAWQAATGKDANSFNITPGFVSANDLHLTTAPTPLESAGASAAVTLVTNDIDNQLRPGPVGSVNGGGTNPDIGADEFDATPIFPPTISFTSITGTDCNIALAHTIVADAAPVSGTFSSLVVNYSYNGVAQTPIAMTNTTGNTYTATIPAATPVNANVTWTIVATNSFGLVTQYTGAAYTDQLLFGITASAVATPATICAGQSTLLSATFNTPLATYDSPSVGAPTSDEDLGNVTISQAGTVLLNNTTAINSLTGTLGTAVGTAGSFSNFTDLATVNMVAGQTYDFSISSITVLTPYLNSMAIFIDWNRNGLFTDAGEMVYTPPATISGPHTRTGSFTVPAWAFGKMRMRVVCLETLITGYGTTSSYGEREDYMLNVVGATAWYQGATLLSNNATLPQTPATTTDYYAAVGAQGCQVTSAPVTVTVNQLPTAPTATPSSQCGVGVPTASVASGAGAAGSGSFYWYDAATAGTIVQMPPVASTWSNFYNSNFAAAGLEVIISGTAYLDEVSWTLTDNTAASIGSGGNYNFGSTNTQTISTLTNAPYTFALETQGAFNDNIATYTIKCNGVTVLTGTLNGGLTYSSSVAACTTTLPTGAALSGTASLTAIPGWLQLTGAVNSQQGGITVAQGINAPAYKVEFDVQTTAGGADGFSWSFAPDASATATAPAAEQGTGTKVKISFDAYGTMPNGVGTYLLYNNTAASFNATSVGVLGFNAATPWLGTASAHVIITINELGQLTLNIDGTDLFTNVALPASYLTDNKASWKHVISARTGGLNMLTAIDNLSVQYKWYGAGNTTIGNTIATTTTYYVTEAGTNGCFSALTPVVATVVNPNPIVLTNGLTPTYCQGATYTEAASSSASPAYNFTWSSNDPNSGITAPVNSASLSVTPIPGVYTVTVTGTNGVCTAVQDVTLTINPNPIITTATATNAICTSDTVQVAASSVVAVNGPATMNNGTGLNTTTTYPSPYANWYWGARQQYLFTAAELTALNVLPGNISSVAFDVTQQSTAAGFIDYTIKMANSSVTALTTTFETGLTQVYYNANLTPSGLGYANNTLVFQTPFVWDGTSNVVIEICFNNGSYTNNAIARNSTTFAGAGHWVFADNANNCSNPSGGTISATRINMQFGASIGTNYTSLLNWAWTGLNTTGSTSSSIEFNTGSAPITEAYTVQATYPLTGCQSTATTNFATINPLPVVSAGPNVLICSNNATEQQTLAGSGAATYTWNNGVTNNVPFAVGATGNYIVTGTDVNGCVNVDTMLLTYSTIPVANAGVDQAICFGQTATLNASGLAPFNWTMTNYANSGLAAAVNDVPALIVTPSAPGTYTYQVNVQNSVGCTNNDAATLTVYTLPVVNAGVDQTICNASPVILAGAGALSYAWNNGVTNATPFFPGSTATYTVVGTDANGCQNQDQVVVNVLPQPIVLGGLDQTICAGTPIILNASTTSATPTAVTGFQWSNNVPNNTQYVPTNSATLTVTATGANGCTNQDQIVVTVLALPTVNAGQDFTVCAGLSATLNASGAVSYAWNNGVTQGIPFYPNASQTYTVVGTGANGCTNNDQVMVTVSTGPTVNLSAPQTVCANTPASISAAVQNSLGGFWTTTNGTGVISPNVTNGTVTYTPSVTDPVVVNLTYVATNACGSASQNTTVTVLPIPVVNAGPDFAVCQGTSATLTATGTGFLTWTTPNVTNGVAFVPATTASYNVVATGFNNCTNSDQVTVTVLALPDVNAGTDQTICSGESVTLNGEGAVSYQWNGGAANGVAFAPSTTATYTVTGTGLNGCENTDQMTVVVNATPVALISVVNDVTLAATPAGMNYQWINCASGTDVPNGSTANFTAIENGSYAVIVTSAQGCSDQSDCEVIDAVGLDQIAAIEMSVNPNPTVGELTINMPAELTAQAQVFDAQGKLVLDASSVSNGSVLNLQNMTTGVYMVRITADNSVQTFRVVKQ